MLGSLLGGGGKHSAFFLSQLEHMLALNYVLKGVMGTPDHQGCDETKEAGSLSLKECSHHEVDLADYSHSTASDTGSGEIRQRA